MGVSTRVTARVLTIGVALLLVGACSPSSPAGPTSAPTAAKPAAGTTAPPAAQQATPLRVAFTPGHSTLAVHAALVNGYFKQNGLDVTLTEGQDLPTFIAALDKQYDISMTTAPIFLNAVAQGVPVKAVAGMQLTVSDPPTNPLLTKNPAINSVKDLAGKTVGGPTLTGEGLQFASVVALTVSFGLGLSATIHFLNRLRLESTPGTSPALAVQRATVLVGPAVIHPGGDVEDRKRHTRGGAAS